MRCPKCGYNSFDHLDSCRKCGKELTEHKQRFGIKSVLFPGQMKPVMAAEHAPESADEDMGTAAATVAVAGSALAGSAAASFGGEASSSEADDFGFDFMGESDEEEDLSFDELFEEAPVDEDVEETLPEPKPEPVAPVAEAADVGFDFMGESDEEEDVSFDELFEEAPVDEDVEETLPGPKPVAPVAEAADFSFDSAGENEASTETIAPELDLDNDFGFDIDAADEPASDDVPGKNLAADDFALPPADDDDFDFNTDEIEFAETEEDAGTKGDPKDPFEVPESPQDEEAPVQNLKVIADQPVRLVEDADDPQPSQAQESVPDLSESAAVAFSDLPVDERPVPEPDELEVELFDISGSDAELLQVSEPDIEQLKIKEPDVELSEVNEPEVDVRAEPVAADDELLLAEVDDSQDGLLHEEREPAIVPIDEVLGAGNAGSGAVVAGTVAAVAATAMTPAESDVFPQEELSHAQSSSAPAPSPGRRIVAFFCDLALLSGVAASFIIAAEAAMAGSSERLLPSLATLIDLSVPYFLVLFSLAFSYFTLFHFLVGQTPGKMLTGLRVETLEGDPLGFSQAFLRSVGGLLQVLPIGLGYLVVLISPDRRGWNDRLAGTRLISLPDRSENLTA